MISDSIGYAGIAILGIFVLFILICCLRGFSKSFNGLFCTMLVIILSLLLVGAFNDKIVESKIGQSLQTKLEEKSASWGEIFTSPARNIDTNGDGTQDTVQILVKDGEGSEHWVNMSDAPTDKKIVSWVVAKLAPRFITTDGEEGSPEQTLAGQLMGILTTVIIAACFFIACVIVLSIIFAILRHIFKAIAKAAIVGKAIDKILGAIIGVVFALMIIWVALAIMQACKGVGKTQEIIDTYITPCKITNFFYQYNYIGKLFEKIFVG